jgi:hypothetical protein
VPRAPGVMLDRFVTFGSPAWWLFFGLVGLGRAADLFSTWLATPNLALEANPVARRLGWRGGLAVNLGLALAFGCWPMLAISLATTSALVAARNLQQAWLMRTMGENWYRLWFAERIAESPRALVFGCHWGEALLVAAVGTGLMLFSGWRLVPFSVGLGLTAYGVAVAFFTTLSLWRLRR